MPTIQSFDLRQTSATMPDPQVQQPTPEMIATQIMTANKSKNIGPFLMGLAVGALFFGVVVCQTVRWIPHRRQDWRHVQVLVWLALIGVTVTEGLAWAYAFNLFVLNYGTYIEFLSWRWISWFGFLDMAVVLPQRIFFAERAYRMSSRSKLFLAAISIALIGSITGGVGITTTLFPVPLLGDTTSSKPFVYLCPTSCAAADTLITCVISFHLLKNKTGWAHTDKLITKLVVLTAEAQVPGFLVAIAFLIHTLVNRTDFFAVFLMMIYGMPYMIGTMAVLNQKHTDERERGTWVATGDNKLSSTQSSRPRQETVVVDDQPIDAASYFKTSGPTREETVPVSSPRAPRHTRRSVVYARDFEGNDIQLHPLSSTDSRTNLREAAGP
ncbi:hypothetical protein DB88DRAFT_488867 [Papiliotrema laurentii]|uniref:DUF6534 domain-containing protein n=1 Tax=Papiliotrema laurentii TaxID=5418 RepID=A0AAD9D088_PAPLA|nr:hypothetical protein DB88DRAFT_488867 [Papiliotrema laurentii]